MYKRQVVTRSNTSKYTLGTVSYTHLDVYKRQAGGICSLTSKAPAGGDPATCPTTGLWLAPWQDSVFEVDYVRVYKRGLLADARRMADIAEGRIPPPRRD